MEILNVQELPYKSKTEARADARSKGDRAHVLVISKFRADPLLWNLKQLESALSGQYPGCRKI